MEIPNAKEKKSVFTITERDGRTYWTRIGIGFVNRDGSITLKLEALPTNGTLQVREYESPEQRAENYLRRRQPETAAA